MLGDMRPNSPPKLQPASQPSCPWQLEGAPELGCIPKRCASCVTTPAGAGKPFTPAGSRGRQLRPALWPSCIASGQLLVIPAAMPLYLQSTDTSGGAWLQCQSGQFANEISTHLSPMEGHPANVLSLCSCYTACRGSRGKHTLCHAGEIKVKHCMPCACRAAGPVPHTACAVPASLGAWPRSHCIPRTQLHARGRALLHLVHQQGAAQWQAVERPGRGSGTSAVGPAGPLPSMLRTVRT